MYKKGQIVKTEIGQARIIATKLDPHIINGNHPFKSDGEELFPQNGKDYVVAFKNTKENEFLAETYKDMTELELKSIEIH
jgi:hypothetical protein